MEAFKGLSKGGQDEHKIMLEKFTTANETWLKANEMHATCIRHKRTLTQLVLRMQNGAKESSFKPFAIDFNVHVDFNSYYKYVVIFCLFLLYAKVSGSLGSLEEKHVFATSLYD